jgi:hypothetical protein
MSSSSYYWVDPFGDVAPLQADGASEVSGDGFDVGAWGDAIFSYDARSFAAEEWC